MLHFDGQLLLFKFVFSYTKFIFFVKFAESSKRRKKLADESCMEDSCLMVGLMIWMQLL